MNTQRLLFLGGCLSAAIYGTIGPDLPIQGGGEMVMIAINLMQTGEFANPFALTIKTGPTAVVPPLYPGFLALLFKVFGYASSGVPLFIWSILIQGLHASLLPRVSVLLFSDHRPGLYAALVSILLPTYSPMPYWDAICTASGVMLYCVASDKWMTVSKGRAPLACGAYAGVLALLSPISVLVSVTWGLMLLARHHGRLRACLHSCMLFGAAFIAILSPWLLRNYAMLRTFSVRTNFGMTVFASNNNCADSAHIDGLRSGCYAAHHPAGSIAEAELLKNMGEARYDAFRTASTIEWVSRRPARFAALTALRVLEFWFPSASYGWYGYVTWFVTALSVPGLFFMCRSLPSTLKFTLAVFAIYPLLYYVVVSDYRYRYPILWLSLLAAGYFINIITMGFRRRATAASTAARVV